ncbi:Methyltransferase domain-containing protein [Desulfatibacillum alkenivorans DSM 16219]|jgi:predicted O-methyltransferase YrrM|uniref:Methyltransferase domain-containing protein n=1 Tax=Desulfatibacillum alkenivorans DSM 16219 TaxID=1121393 RepID=A0A1M6E403_9BACT|nr:class I SAM-dependent methyltransferase [Desulfatibacillum alkenivorans]SHI80123.1 Methyltransferase domain-containing protein [Desulfatibacillum alkenivorans DSM 16219]
MDIKTLYNLPVKGFLALDEAQRLYDIALEAGAKGPCLEIGSYCGKSTLFLGTACKEAGAVLFSIDHHRGNEEQQPGEEYHDSDLVDGEGRMDTFPFFRKTLETAGLEDTVIAMVTRSRIASRQWATPLALVFIDGGHTFEAAYTDYVSWAGHVMPGGYLAIHDIFDDPAKGGQAPYEIYNLAKASKLFEECPMTGTLGVLRRL